MSAIPSPSTRQAARAVAIADRGAKDGVLLAIARQLEAGQAELLEANAQDLAALPKDASTAFRDRLRLDAARVRHMAESLCQVAELPDPVGEELDRRQLVSGVLARRVRSPLGVILMIFESRPNVAIEAFSLGFKAGNAMILRGGKESARTVAVLYAWVQAALRAGGFPPEVLQGITDPDRALVLKLLQLKEEIDVVVPRGGDSLIEFVVANSKIPVIKNDRGLCHVYVDEDADLEMAARIVENAKCQRPGVCNSMETLLVHAKVAEKLLPALHERLTPHFVEWWCDPKALQALGDRPRLFAAKPESWDTEYLDFKLNCRVVQSFEEALAHIALHGSRHSEAIITKSEPRARRFQGEVDAAAVYWNASTRFTDGFELGLGGELGISTQKLHVRGPVGLRELTSVRWLMDGTGQVRE